jgi:hypothetical protein
MRPSGADRRERIVSRRYRVVRYDSDRRFKTIEATRRVASSIKAPIGVEPIRKGFADLPLPTWVRRHV